MNTLINFLIQTLNTLTKPPPSSASASTATTPTPKHPANSSTSASITTASTNGKSPARDSALPKLISDTQDWIGRVQPILDQQLLLLADTHRFHEGSERHSAQRDRPSVGAPSALTITTGPGWGRVVPPVTQPAGHSRGRVGLLAAQRRRPGGQPPHRGDNRPSAHHQRHNRRDANG